MLQTNALNLRKPEPSLSMNSLHCVGLLGFPYELDFSILLSQANI